MHATFLPHAAHACYFFGAPPRFSVHDPTGQLLSSMLQCEIVRGPLRLDLERSRRKEKMRRGAKPMRPVTSGVEENLDPAVEAIRSWLLAWVESDPRPPAAQGLSRWDVRVAAPSTAWSPPQDQQFTVRRHWESTSRLSHSTMGHVAPRGDGRLCPRIGIAYRHNVYEKRLEKQTTLLSWYIDIYPAL
nr:uncharacterized protein LOC127312500 [Lolium perenne]